MWLGWYYSTDRHFLFGDYEYSMPVARTVGNDTVYYILGKNALIRDSGHLYAKEAGLGSLANPFHSNVRKTAGEMSTSALSFMGAKGP